jgi:hypothetical protein
MPGHVSPRCRVILALLAACGTSQSFAASADSIAERFWLAGRYDGNRVIVYFDAVKFGAHFPPNVAPLAPAIAEGFFTPLRLSTAFVNSMKRKPTAEHFHVGDRFDLLLGHDHRTHHHIDHPCWFPRG